MIDYNHIFHEFMDGNMQPLYQFMYRGMMLYAVKVLGDEMSFMAEDCVQEAIMYTYENREIFDSSNHWRNYLLTCVKNNANLALRKRNAHSRYLTELSFQNPQQENALAVLRQETLDSLYMAIETLPKMYREVFRLSFEEGLKNREIAELLNIAEITVKKRKNRLIKLLRPLLGLPEEDILLLLLSIFLPQHA